MRHPWPDCWHNSTTIATYCGRLGDKARQKALADFDERLVIEKTIEVYAELLSAFPRAAHATAS